MLGLLFTLGSALLAHLVLARTLPSPALREALTLALIPVQAWAITSIALPRLLPAARGPYYNALVTLLLSLACYRLAAGLVITTGVVHAGINLLLLLVFASSLREGAQPLITRLARRIHGELRADVAHYTRQVTVVWCGFFALQLALSAALLAFAPLAWWSTFVNLCNLPLLALLFFGEHVFRRCWLRDPPRESLADCLRMGQWFGAGLGKGDLPAPPAATRP